MIKIQKIKESLLHAGKAKTSWFYTSVLWGVVEKHTPSIHNSIKGEYKSLQSPWWSSSCHDFQAWEPVLNRAWILTVKCTKGFQSDVLFPKLLFAGHTISAYVKQHMPVMLVEHLEQEGTHVDKALKKCKLSKASLGSIISVILDRCFCIFFTFLSFKAYYFIVDLNLEVYDVLDTTNINFLLASPHLRTGIGQDKSLDLRWCNTTSANFVFDVSFMEAQS